MIGAILIMLLIVVVSAAILIVARLAVPFMERLDDWCVKNWDKRK